MLTSTSTVCTPSMPATRDSANGMPLARITVSPLAARTPGAISSALSISPAARGPGSGSTTERSHGMPPTIGLAPWKRRQCSATACAPTTFPPPPIPITSGRLAVVSSRIADTFLGHERGHELRGRDVERVVRRGVPMRAHLGRVALLDRDVGAGWGRWIDRRGGGGDDEWDAVVIGEHGERVRADL